MSEKLKPCPCGKTPTKLVLEEGATCKYAYCGGNCCGAWLVEFPTGYAHVSSYAAMELAIPAWNSAMRKGMEKDDDKEMSEATIRQIMKGTKDDELESLRIKLNVAVKAGKALRMENERLRAENETAFQCGQASRKCECGETSTGWTEWPCCNICGSIVENTHDMPPEERG